MQRFFSKLELIAVGFVCVSSLLNANVSYALMTQSPNAWPTDAAIQVQRYNANIQKVVAGVQSTADAAIQGTVGFVTDGITDAVSSVSETISDAYEEGTKYVDGKIEEAGNYASEKASEWGDKISSSFSSSSEKPGEGFSLSEKLKGAKKAMKEYSQYLAPAAQLAQGNFLGAASSIRENFYVGSKGKDALSSYDVAKVQANLKKFIQDASKTIIADATQVMNGSSQYSKVQKSSANDKPANVREDITSQNDSALAMNVMTNVLLSMDITDLSIQSALIYNNINNVSTNSFLLDN